MVVVQAKFKMSTIAPEIIGPVAEPRPRPQLIRPVIIPYVCRLSFW